LSVGKTLNSMSVDTRTSFHVTGGCRGELRGRDGRL